MRATAAARKLPRALREHVLHFECEVEKAAQKFAAELDPFSRVLDAGAGEGAYRGIFAGHRYFGVDLAVGDASWNYTRLDAVADLRALPFPDAAFDAVLNIVTLEHVTNPEEVVEEMARVLRAEGRLFLVAPQEWEVHQHPHDYYRYTRFGLEHLFRSAGLEVEQMRAVGGFYRLLARRLLNGIAVTPMPWKLLWALPAGAAALLLPLLERFDVTQNFTLGYIAIAKKPSAIRE